ALQRLFNRERPILLTLVYFRCPMLCTLVMNGVVKALRGTGWKLGRDFDAVTVSFDPTDTPARAADQRRSQLQALGEDVRCAAGWPFLTGKQDVIRALAGAVGFEFNYDPSIEQY